MAEAKTKPTSASVPAFLKKAAKGERLGDCQTLVKIMQKATGARPVMWGPSIVGFGTYTITYADGRTADWPATGFSPRSTSLVLYIGRGFPTYPTLLKNLGKAKPGGGCLYLKSLAGVDVRVLTEMIDASVKARKKG